MSPSLSLINSDFKPRGSCHLHCLSSTVTPCLDIDSTCNDLDIPDFPYPWKRQNENWLKQDLRIADVHNIELNTLSNSQLWQIPPLTLEKVLANSNVKKCIHIPLSSWRFQNINDNLILQKTTIHCYWLSAYKLTHKYKCLISYVSIKARRSQLVLGWVITRDDPGHCEPGSVHVDLNLWLTVYIAVILLTRT